VGNGIGRRHCQYSGRWSLVRGKPEGNPSDQAGSKKPQSSLSENSPVFRLSSESAADYRCILQKAEARKQATPTERIALLEQTKPGLISKRTMLEDKIAQLEARSSGREEKKIAQGRPF